jgi:hypothetical protein
MNRNIISKYGTKNKKQNIEEKKQKFQNIILIIWKNINKDNFEFVRMNGGQIKKENLKHSKKEK